MISFTGSINLHIILKKVKDLLQEKLKIFKYYFRNTKECLEKSKSKINKSDLFALENELKKKKEICDKINFEKELALIKVKNLKNSAIPKNRNKQSKKFKLFFFLIFNLNL